MRQDPGEQGDENRGIGPGDLFEIFGATNRIESHHDGVADRLGRVANAGLAAA